MAIVHSGPGAGAFAYCGVRRWTGHYPHFYAFMAKIDLSGTLMISAKLWEAKKQSKATEGHLETKAAQNPAAHLSPCRERMFPPSRSFEGDETGSNRKDTQLNAKKSAFTTDVSNDFYSSFWTRPNGFTPVPIFRIGFALTWAKAQFRSTRPGYAPRAES